MSPAGFSRPVSSRPGPPQMGTPSNNRQSMHSFSTPAMARQPAPSGWSSTSQHAQHSTPSNSSGSANSSFEHPLDDEHGMPFNDFAPQAHTSFSSIEAFISNDLFHVVVQDYGLNTVSSMRLAAFREIVGKLPGMTKEVAVPIFFILAAVLHGQQLTEQLRVQVPPMENLVSMFEKLENRLSLIPFRLSEIHMENIRSLANGIIFEPSNYSFNDLPERLYAACEAKKASLHFGEAFETPANSRILNQECSKIASSVKNGLREYILKSIDPSSKGKLQSLAMCTYRLAEKYRGKGAMPHRADCVKTAMLRRFGIEHPELRVIETDPQGQPPAKRKASSDSSVTSPPSATGANTQPAPEPIAPYGVTLFENGTMQNHRLEMVAVPTCPMNPNFWQLWDWHYKRLQVALGPKDSEAWARYVSDIVEMDRKAFPIEKGASGIDRIDEQLFSGTSSSAATTAEPRPAVVSYSGVTI